MGFVDDVVRIHCKYVAVLWRGSVLLQSKADSHHSGIGLETAVDLAGRGARVILACCSKQKGEAAIDVVKKRSKSENAVFETRLDSV